MLSVPDTHQIMFLGSASEAWERILLNCVEHESFHLVNGSFSQKFRDYANALHKYTHSYEKPMGQGFDAAEVTVPEHAEIMCVTHNETSSGVQMRAEEIHKLKTKYPDKLLAVDMVSSAPYPALDYGLVNTAFFSVQKAFGMPAGLGVWIVDEKCLAKAERLKKYDSPHYRCPPQPAHFVEKRAKIRNARYAQCTGYLHFRKNCGGLQPHRGGRNSSGNRA